MKQDQILSLVRHALSAVAGILIAKGVTTETISLDVIGTILAIITSVWSVKAKTLGITQLEGVIRQVLTTLGMFLNFLTPSLTLEIVGALMAVLPTILGLTNATKDGEVIQITKGL